MKINFVFVTMLLGMVACSNSATPTPGETMIAVTPTETEIQVTPTKIPVTLTASPTLTVTPTIPQTPLPLQTKSDPLMAGLIYSWDYDYWLIDSWGDHSLVDRTRRNYSPNGQYTLTTEYGTEDDSDIFLTDLATGEQINLTNTEQFSTDPLWSQDGKLVYYIEGDEYSSDIWNVDITTLEKTRLTQTSDRHEAWLFRVSAYPDLLFFYSWPSDVYPGEGFIGDFSNVKIDGSDYVVLSYDLGRYPVFSPDRKTIGLMSSSYDEEDNYFRETLLYTPGSESQPFPLEKYVFDELSDVEIASSLSWSPNQTKIAIWVEAQREGDDFFGIVVLDLLNLTTEVIGEYKAPTGWYTPYAVEWSKDSQWISFYASDSGEDEDYGIWLADQYGRDVRKLNNFGERYDYCKYVWSPDGRWFVYSCGYPDETFGSWLVNLNTLSQSPAELPDGARVTSWPVFVSFEINTYLRITEAGANLNLREAPDLNAPVLLQLRGGEVIQILDGPIETEDFIWWKVRTEGNVDGWVVERRGWYAPAVIP